MTTGSKTEKRGLSSKLPWQVVLGVLGVDKLPAALPATVTCPACHKARLRIFADTLTGGQYHHCQDCGSCGDMLSLAASVWQLSLTAALLKLRTSGLISAEDSSTEELARHVEQVLSLHEAATAAVSLAGHTLLRDDRAIEMLQNAKLGLGRKATSGRNVAAKLLGCFLPSKIRQQTGDLDGKLRGSIFSGNAPVIAAPTYDRPGRVCGLRTLVVGQATTDEFNSLYGGESQEAGLATHPLVLRRQPAVYAFQELSETVGAQLLHMQLSNKPLPLVVWTATRKARTDAAWDIFHGAKINFWTDRPLQAALWWQLLRTNGWLCWSSPGNTHFLQRQRAEDAIKLISTRSQGWPDALAILSAGWSDNELEGLLLELEATGGSVQQIIDRCQPQLVERIKRLLSITARHVGTTINGRAIEQHADAWYLKTPLGLEMICGAVLQVHEAITYQDGRCELSGIVRFEGQQWSFLADEEELRVNTAGWLSRFLLDKQAGLLRVHSGWKSHLLHLAMALHKPVIRRGYDQVGWQPMQRELVVPRSGMTATCQLKRCRIRGDEAGLPASNLRFSGMLLPHVVSPLTSDTVRHRMFWQLWVRAMYSVCAPIFGMPSHGIALSGEQAYSVGKSIAAGMGCQMLPDSLPIEQMLQAEKRHRWPVFFTATGFVPSATLARLSPQDRNCFLRTTTLQAKVLDLNGGWTTVYADTQGQSRVHLSLVQPAQMLTECFLPHVLKLLAENPLLRMQSVGDMAELATQWLAQWRLKLPEIKLTNVTTAFSWLLSDLIAWNRLELLPLDQWSGHIEQGCCGVLSWTKLQAALQELNAPPLNLDVLEQIQPNKRNLTSRDVDGDYRILIPLSLMHTKVRGRLQKASAGLKIYNL